MENTAVVVVETAEVVQARELGSKTLARANELARNIKDDQTLGLAADYLLVIKRQRKEWAEFNKPAKQKLDALKRELLDRERQIDEPLERAETQILKPAMAQYQVEQERIRRAEEERQRAILKAQEEDARLAEAAAAEKNGDKEAAEALINAPVNVPPVILPKPEATKGVSYREVWKFRITNVNIIPREYLAVDEQKIGGVVRSLKENASIPGVEVYSEKSVAVGAGR